MKVHGV
jgi:hypothetical protein